MKLYLCVITYQYANGPFEVCSAPTSRAHADWLMVENGRLNPGSEHVLSARVYSQEDYRTHQRVADRG